MTQQQTLYPPQVYYLNKHLPQLQLSHGIQPLQPLFLRNQMISQPTVHQLYINQPKVGLEAAMKTNVYCIHNEQKQSECCQQMQQLIPWQVHTTCGNGNQQY